MWSAIIAGLLNKAYSISDIVRLLKRDKDVRMVCGFSLDNLPGEDAFSRFLKKLSRHTDLFEECLAILVQRLRELLPGFGSKLAVDSTDIIACSKGHRQNPSDADARWGAKKKSNSQSEDRTGGSQKEPKPADLYFWFGYKLHLAIDAVYELPIAFTLTPANVSDTLQMEPLLKKAGADQEKTRPQAVIADKGYDSQDNHQFIYKECQSAPIIPIRERKGMQLADICNAKGTPLCSCGLDMVYWGRDGKYLK